MPIEADDQFRGVIQMPNAEEGTEPWFQLPYTCAPLTAEVLQGWSDAPPAADLALPAANAYLPTDFTLVAAPFSSAAAAAADGVSSHGNTVAVQVCVCSCVPASLRACVHASCMYP